MSYFPDARTGENGYKDTDLKGERAAFLRGFDCAVDEIKNLFKGNLEMYSGDSLILHYIAKHEEEAEEVKKQVAENAKKLEELDAKQKELEEDVASLFGIMLPPEVPVVPLRIQVSLQPAA